MPGGGGAGEDQCGVALTTPHARRRQFEDAAFRAWIEVRLEADPVQAVLITTIPPDQERVCKRRDVVPFDNLLPATRQI